MRREIRFGFQPTAEIQAIQRIFGTYGHEVGILDKAKTLRKFGRTDNADSGVRTTIAQFPGSVVNETFATTNSVDSIVSTSASDTGSVRLEHHTIDANGKLTFGVQNVTLNGTTPVTLDTPAARFNRFRTNASGSFASPASDMVGDISVYDSTLAGGVTSGTPNDATSVKLFVPASTNSAKNNSYKGATSTSQFDYWLLTGARFTIRGSAANTVNVEFDLEMRDVANGGAWVSLGPEVSVRAGGQSTERAEYPEYLIVPPSHDIRAIAVSNTNNTSVSCAMFGYLARIVRDEN